jgi:hypothetical protein
MKYVHPMYVFFLYIGLCFKVSLHYGAFCQMYNKILLF